MSSSGKLFALLAALVLASATGLGAYTSHGLETVLAPPALGAVETAVQYQFYHGLGLLGVALLADRLAGAAAALAGWLLFVGTLLFCGGIYAHYLLGFAGAAVLAPFGGAAMIAGWLVVAFAAAKAIVTAPR